MSLRRQLFKVSKIRNRIHCRLILFVSMTSVSVVTLRVDSHVWRGRWALQAFLAKTHRGLSVIILTSTPGLRGTSSVYSAHVAAPLRGIAEPATTVVSAQSISGSAIFWLKTDSAFVIRVNHLCVSQSHSAMLRPPPDTRMTGCQYKETFLFLVFVFRHWSSQKPHTKPWEPLIFLLGRAWDGSRLSRWCWGGLCQRSNENPIIPINLQTTRVTETTKSVFSSWEF